MERPAAIAAQLVDVRNVGQHKCVKLTIHVPAEQAGMVMEAFGWPTMVDPVPVALARMNAAGTDAAAGEAVNLTKPGLASPSLSPDKPATDRNLAQRAGALCTKPVFWQFLNETSKCIPRGCSVTTKEEATVVLRTECDVKSRADIIPGTPAGDKFEQLDSRFKLWNYGPKYIEGAA